MIKVFSYLNLCLYLTKAIEYPEMYPDYYSDMYPEPSETYISEVRRHTQFTPAGIGTCFVWFILQIFAPMNKQNKDQFSSRVTRCIFVVIANVAQNTHYFK